MMTVKFFPNEKGSPPGKLADAELHFETNHRATRVDDGGTTTASEALAGLKLIGFAVWARKSGAGARPSSPGPPSMTLWRTADSGARSI